MLESAFMLHITDKSIVHKVVKGGDHGFKIVLNGGDQGLFDLTYFYNPRNWNLTSAAILSLPHAWELFLPSGEVKNMNAVVLLIKAKEESTPTCILGFSLSEPFLAHVSSSKSQSGVQKSR